MSHTHPFLIVRRTGRGKLKIIDQGCGEQAEQALLQSWRRYYGTKSGEMVFSIVTRDAHDLNIRLPR